MAEAIDGRPARRLRLVFEGQGLHVVAVAVLIGALAAVSTRPSFDVGELWGVGTLTWFWIAVWLPVAHQLYVWFCWRMQLHMELLTRTLRGSAFATYATGFAVLGIARAIVPFLLAIANQDTIAFDPITLRVLAVLALIPALYLFYSVKRYFTFTRAFGIDHFDPSYRRVPFVRRGIFRFTSNGMYVYGFLLFWVPALWWASEAALWVAIFNHIYIWVHYYATERPDMKRIYGL